MKKITHLTTPSRFASHPFKKLKGNLSPFLTLLRAYALTLFFLFPFLAYTQNTMVINLTDHTKLKNPIDNIQRITFNGDNLVLKPYTGTEKSYPLANIASVTFINEVGVKEVEGVTGVNVYVNGSGEIVVESPHSITQLTVFDLTGRTVALGSQNKMNVNFLNTGIYILQVTTDKGIVNKKFIKK